MRTWLKILACVSLVPGAALSAPLDGRWEGGDRAAESIYGTILINGNSVSWGRNPQKPDSKTNIAVVIEPVGTTFKNQVGVTSVVSADASFSTFKVQLNPPCNGNVVALRFTIPNNDSDYMALVEYGADSNPLGYMHFVRVNPSIERPHPEKSSRASQFEH
jgi:hypothetical protein